MGSAVLYAIKDAVKAARKDSGYDQYNFKLDSPATAARIRMACQDNITSKVNKKKINAHLVIFLFQLEEPEPGSFKPWNVIV